MLRPLLFKLRTLRRKLTPEGVKAVTAAAAPTERGYLAVPVEAFEAAMREHARPLHPIPADYDPARDKDKGRCCS